MQLETNPFTKLIWFFSNPLPNALALFALRDDYDTGIAIYGVALTLVAGIIFWGCRSEIARVGRNAKRRILVCALVLPFVAHAVSLAAAERSLGYRTLFALSGLVLVLLVFALRSLRAAEKIQSRYYHGALGALVLIAVTTAHFNTVNLIALPQSYEWETIRLAVMRADFPRTARVFIVTPTIGDRATTRVFADEFGALSGDSDWAPREMFKAALHERYPVKMPKGTHCEVELGREMPDAKAYDLVIDMRNFKERAQR
jgi:F0F1-type ATP synthase assembly protein I